MQLTEPERVAADFFIRLLTNGFQLPCEQNLPAKETELPPWFDENKCERGQQYFDNNRFGVSSTQLSGLICLLAESNGLQILMSTGRSSTPETARDRYISTISHVSTWFENILSPGSETWKSLRKVRRMHYYASISANKMNLGFITQAELVITTFGFMGFALVRPKYFGVKCDNREDLEGFVHLWACICYMLGIEDKYNMCLLEFDAIKVFCQMLIRYIFVPLLQVETADFKLMASASVTGLNHYLKIIDYESQLFILKSALGIPGYQYGHDMEEMLPCRDILTRDDIARIKQTPFKDYDLYLHLSDKILLYEFNETEKNFRTNENCPEETILIQNFIQTKTGKKVQIKIIRNEIEFRNNLNDSKFRQLSFLNRKTIQGISWLKRIYRFKLGKFLLNNAISFTISLMRKHVKSKKQH